MGHSNNGSERPGRRPGWVSLRTGLEDHFRDGRLGPSSGFVFLRLMMLVQVEGRPDLGAVWTSAADLASRVIPGMTERAIQGALRTLEGGLYIRRWRSLGSRGTYPITIHQWEFGTHSGRVNAWDSEAWDKPATTMGTHVEPRNSRGNPKRNSNDGSQGTQTPATSPEAPTTSDASASSMGTQNEPPRELKSELTREHRLTPFTRRERQEEQTADGGPSAEPGLLSLPADQREKKASNGSDPSSSAMVGAWAATLARHGLPADRYGARRQAALERKAGQVCASLEIPGDDPRWPAAMNAAMTDPYLRSRGFPIDLFLSQAPRFVRLAAGATENADDDRARRAAMAMSARRKATKHE